MSHKNKEKMTDQVHNILTSKFSGLDGGFGHKRHEDKRDGADKEKIYMSTTFHTYKKHCIQFVRWARETYHCNTLDKCRAHANEWLKMRAKACSASTVSLERAALAKLYGETGNKDAFEKTPTRHRVDIKRSRGRVANDAHFSERKNQSLLIFLRATGMRRFEAEKAKGSDLRRSDDEKTWYFEIKGKGGKIRLAPIIGDHAEEIVALAKEKGDKKIWGKISSACDVHSYRRQYAQTMYKMHAHDFKTCKRKPFFNPQHYNGPGKPKGGWEKDSVYWMRADMKGHWLDKQAMLIVSRALGHNRISVVADHYLDVEKL